MKHEKIGVCDIVGTAYRDKIDASDLGMQQVELRDLLGILQKHPAVDSFILQAEIARMVQSISFASFLKQRKSLWNA